MSVSVRIAPSWGQRLAEEFQKPYFAELVAFVKNAYQTTKVYPAAKDIFRAFDLCPFEAVKVVLLGQDPYHGHHQANGLCFAVPPGVTPPPSLVNIFNELRTDLGTSAPPNGDLSRWAEQGVLLLNATLTVEAGRPGSHQNKGWEVFTDTVIQRVSDELEHVVFILWGSYAQKKGSVINRRRHLVLEAPHPSPFSANRGFFGSRPFSQTNAYLVAHGKKGINW